eukprot:IDg9490t1
MRFCVYSERQAFRKACVLYTCFPLYGLPWSAITVRSLKLRALLRQSFACYPYDNMGRSLAQCSLTGVTEEKVGVPLFLNCASGYWGRIPDLWHQFKPATLHLTPSSHHASTANGTRRARGKTNKRRRLWQEKQALQCASGNSAGEICILYMWLI